LLSIPPFKIRLAGKPPAELISKGRSDRTISNLPAGDQEKIYEVSPAGVLRMTAKKSIPLAIDLESLDNPAGIYLY